MVCVVRAAPHAARPGGGTAVWCAPFHTLGRQMMWGGRGGCGAQPLGRILITTPAAVQADAVAQTPGLEHLAPRDPAEHHGLGIGEAPATLDVDRGGAVAYRVMWATTRGWCEAASEPRAATRPTCMPALRPRLIHWLHREHTHQSSVVIAQSQTTTLRRRRRRAVHIPTAARRVLLLTPPQP